MWRRAGVRVRVGAGYCTTTGTGAGTGKPSLVAIKDLRSRTGAGISDCKNALTEAQGDLPLALTLLLQRARAKALLKAHRTAAEGLVALASSPDASLALLLEVNSETDFVPRLEGFQELVRNTANAALEKATKEHSAKPGQLVSLPVDWLKQLVLPSVWGSRSVDDSMVALFGQVGENLVLRRASLLVAPEHGIVGGFVQGTGGIPNLGSVGSMIALKWKGPSDTTASSALANSIARHVAVYEPLAIDVASLPAGTSKDAALVEQLITDEEGQAESIQALLQAQEREKGLSDLHISNFVRWACGEGVERAPTVDFAEAVQQELDKRKK